MPGEARLTLPSLYTQHGHISQWNLLLVLHSNMYRDCDQGGSLSLSAQSIQWFLIAPSCLTGWVTMVLSLIFWLVSIVGPKTQNYPKTPCDLLYIIKQYTSAHSSSLAWQRQTSSCKSKRTLRDKVSNRPIISTINDWCD